jgi:hypothetical protein
MGTPRGQPLPEGASVDYPPYAEYFAKIAARAISSLQAISDEAFARGLGALERHCREREDRPIDEPVEIFLFGAARGRR